MSTVTATDQALLARAIELASRGIGYVTPNPNVGAVIARGDEIVAEGWHDPQLLLAYQRRQH